MKLRYSLFLLLSLIIMCISQELISQQFKWKGHKEVKNGVTYIYNPEKPIHYRKELPFPKLTEIMSIGVFEGDERYVFGSIGGIAYDSKENLYVLDILNHCIKVYDKQGKYLRQIGRHGQGPGEFDNPTALLITPDDNLIVYDFRNRRICILSPDGEFKRSFMAPPYTTPKILLNKKNEIISVRTLSESTFKFLQERYPPYTHLSLNGKKLLSYGESQLIEKNGISKYSPNIAGILPNNNLLTVFCYPYKIQEYDPSGMLIREIVKEDKLFSEIAVISRKRSRKKSVVIRAVIKELHPFPDGSFLVIVLDYGKDWKRKKTEKFFPKASSRRLDYFNKEGQFLTSYKWDYKNYGSLYFIDKDGYAYTRHDAESIPKLTKYKIKLDF